MTDKDDETEVKTMWSETLLEALYVAMEKKVSDSKVRELLKDLRDKGYKKDYLVEKISKKVGPNAAIELKRIYSGAARTTSTANAGGAAKRLQDTGLVGKIKGLFK